jgi:iron complex outermembrane receptor protein
MLILDDKSVLSPNVIFDNKFFAGTQNFRRTSYGNPADSNSPYELPDQAENDDFWLFYPSGPTYNPKATFGSEMAGNAYHFYGYQTWAAGYSTKMVVSLPGNTVTLGGNLTYGELHSDEFWYGSAPVPQIVGFNDAWDEHDTRLLGSLYVQDDIKLLSDTLTVTPGLKYIYAKTQDTDAIAFFYPYGGTDSNNDHFVSPTLGLNYKPTEHLAFNAAFGQNIKLPDISAYYNAVPGTTSSTPLTPPPITIKPEHVTDYELGARYSDGDLAISLDGYREDFSSIFIDKFNETTFNTIVTNGGTARYQGVELQLADGIHFSDGGYLKGFVNYAYNQANYESNFSSDSVGDGLSDSDDEVTKGERVADVPNTLVSVGATYLKSGYRVDLMARYIGSELMLDQSTGVPNGASVPGYTIVDLGLSKTFERSHSNGLSQNVKLSLYVDNLFNKYYYNTAYTEKSGTAGLTEFATPGAPRSVMGKIDVSF